ncbi:ComEC/Rec2 family competence protein [Novosphingobium flavum]|uniref:ComEC/Rec2 family competence protein n=2 Tax=Novosphingobium flavum TaxID=1778672 RepID=A0A7X1FU55_9SPHN|nr:ComEC/Rec2 family competence protein [Novosphingobium flavum]MBC2666397.1 ComEC/Rec2 family competence protein [Novosphingobium flavum]
MSGLAAPGSASPAPSGTDAFSAPEPATAYAGSQRVSGDSSNRLTAALQQAPWRRPAALSRLVDGLEHFVASAGFDRAPWLAVALGTGIAAWFVLGAPWQWIALLAGLLGLAGLAAMLLSREGRFPYLRAAIVSVALAMAAGSATIWTKSVLTGMPAIERPSFGEITGIVVSRQEQPAEGRTRLVVAIRDPYAHQRIIRVRINVPAARDAASAREGALIRVRARLMPPAAPMLPGGSDFARIAWFQQLAATGTAISPVAVLQPGRDGLLDPLRRSLSAHIRRNLAGSPGGIAAAFASGDRGGIAANDEDAMRDSGLTHLLSVSGLHVSAVIGATYLLALRLLALWPWLALRLRLPIVSAGIAAFVGLAYTLLTGAEVPTVRSVAGAMLVLIAVSLGRSALSVRMLAAAGFAVMLIWPESVVGPSFQLSFAAVLTIVTLHGAAPVRAFAARRIEPLWARALRHGAVLLVTGIAIELALTPIVLFHFHRAGLYGSFANVLAIPLTTFVTMPMIATALLLDLFGAGGPAWWLTGQSLSLLLGMAHFVARQPGAVTMFPTMGQGAFALFVSGGLWLALWHRRIRYWGIVPLLAGTLWLAFLRPPDVLISGDGRHVAFATLAPDSLLMLRDGRSSFARDNLAESAGMDGQITPLDQWPGARCNTDFCALEITKGGRVWHFLMARSHNQAPLGETAAACAGADVVIADRYLPRSCRPAVLKADRSLLEQTGGMALDLTEATIRTVAESQGQHGWWRPGTSPSPRASSEGRASQGPAAPAGNQ